MTKDFVVLFTGLLPEGNKMQDDRLKKILEKKARCGIIGLGYVGLPLAVELAKVGFDVTGIDVDKRKTDAINKGISYIQDVPTKEIKALVKAGKLRATTDFSVLRRIDTINICVPTPLRKSKDPDISYILAATKEIAKYLHKGQLIILESTTYPGTTEEVMQPMLEAKGLKAGRDFHLAFSPERVDPGNPQFNTKNITKVVGGYTPKCTELAVALYSQAIDKIFPVSSTRVAETVKLLENTFRSVNIGMVNEMAVICNKLGINVWEVIDAAATKPFGFMPFYPGPGIGGHCLAANEYIFVKNGTGVQTVKIGDYVNNLSNSDSTLKHQLRDITLVKPQNSQTLSFDMENKTFSYKDINIMSKRAYTGEMKRISTTDGRKITVTDKHPMLVHDADGIIHIRLAQDIQQGDRLPISLALPAEKKTAPVEIDLLEYLKTHLPQDKTTRVKFTTIQIKDFKQKLYPYLRKYAKNYNYKDYFLANSLPLALFYEIEQADIMPIDRKELLLCNGRGPSYNQIKAVIVIDEKFSRLIGYYLSEGCITVEKKATRSRFTFNRDEQDLIQEVETTLDSLAIKYSIYKSKIDYADCLKVSSKHFGMLLKDILKCGTNCYNMQIPSLFFEYTESCRSALLSGLLRGDAGVNHRKGEMGYTKNKKQYTSKYNTANIEYFTSSPTLYQQAVMLSQSLGFIPSFKVNMPTIRFFGHQQLKGMAPLFNESKRAKLDSYFESNEKILSSKKFKRHDSFATVEVKDVETLPGQEVYSMEVDDTNTFVSSYGIVTHNCIPLDPHYLSWRVRLEGYEAKFIELAGQINRSMPEYVINKLNDALNDKGKSVKRSRILVLGVAYKNDIDDVRESPAIDFINQLRKKGAKVIYHDPFIADLGHEGIALKSVPLTVSTVKSVDAVVIITKHKAIDYKWLVSKAKLVIDTRNATKSLGKRHNVVKL